MRIPSSWLPLGASAVALALLASPARAVTCEEAHGLTPTQLSYWAGRLEVSPTYLAALLDKSFCQIPAQQGRVTAQSERRRPSRSPDSKIIQD